MNIDFTKGYTNRSNANRFATKTAKLAKGTFTIEPRDGKFFVVPAAQAATLPGNAVQSASVPAPTEQPAPKATKAPKAKAAKGKSTKGGYKLERKREQKHGVTRQSTGTVGDQLWSAYDKLLAKADGKLDKLSVKDAKAVADQLKLNQTSAVIAFYRWRQFHGQRGRIGLKKAQKGAK